VVHFFDQSAPGIGSIDSWVWTFGDGSPALTILAPGPGDTSHIYSSPGNYTVTLTVTNSYGCSETYTDLVQPSSCLTAAFIQQGPLACAGGTVTFFDQSMPSSLISTWEWFWGDGTDTTYNVFASPVTHTYAGSGTYTVTLIIKTVINFVEFTDTART
jgi:PKD repeat protein